MNTPEHMSSSNEPETSVPPESKKEGILTPVSEKTLKELKQVFGENPDVLDAPEGVKSKADAEVPTAIGKSGPDTVIEKNKSGDFIEKSLQDQLKEIADRYYKERSEIMGFAKGDDQKEFNKKREELKKTAEEMEVAASMINNIKKGKSVRREAWEETEYIKDEKERNIRIGELMRKKINKLAGLPPEDEGESFMKYPIDKEGRREPDELNKFFEEIISPEKTEEKEEKEQRINASPNKLFSLWQKWETARRYDAELKTAKSPEEKEKAQENFDKKSAEIIALAKKILPDMDFEKEAALAYKEAKKAGEVGKDKEARKEFIRAYVTLGIKSSIEPLLLDNEEELKQIRAELRAGLKDKQKLKEIAEQEGEEIILKPIGIEYFESKLKKPKNPEDLSWGTEHDFVSHPLRKSERRSSEETKEFLRGIVNPKKPEGDGEGFVKYPVDKKNRRSGKEMHEFMEDVVGGKGAAPAEQPVKDGGNGDEFVKYPIPEEGIRTGEEMRKFMEDVVAKKPEEKPTPEQVRQEMKDYFLQKAEETKESSPALSVKFSEFVKKVEGGGFSDAAAIAEAGEESLRKYIERQAKDYKKLLNRKNKNKSDQENFERYQRFLDYINKPAEVLEGNGEEFVKYPINKDNRMSSEKFSESMREVTGQNERSEEKPAPEQVRQEMKDYFLQKAKEVSSPALAVKFGEFVEKIKDGGFSDAVAIAQAGEESLREYIERQAKEYQSDKKANKEDLGMFKRFLEYINNPPEAPEKPAEESTEEREEEITIKTEEIAKAQNFNELFDVLEKIKMVEDNHRNVMVFKDLKGAVNRLRDYVRENGWRDEDGERDVQAQIEIPSRYNLRNKALELAKKEAGMK